MAFDHEVSMSFLVVCAIFASHVSAAVAQGTNTNETEARIFLDTFNERAMEEYYKSISASWTYNTNITEYNQAKSVAASLEASAFSAEMRLEALKFNRTGFSFDTERQLNKLVYVGDAALADQELEELTNLLANMETRYSTGKPCKEDGTCYSLEPDLTRIMATSQDYAELYWAWDAWRAEVGAPARSDYARYVELKNEAAQANDQPDNGAYWRSWYEVDDLEDQVEDLYNTLSPLYRNLHAYVRRKLYDVYGPRFINLRGPIPAHVLGNMWAQSWLNLNDLCQPYPDKPSVDITPTLVAEGYTPLRMFQVSDEFFVSLGLIEMPQEFWNHSMIEKPTDGRDVVCHASAWDFYNQVDFRILQCTTPFMEDFVTIHHEMGHIQYFLQFKDLHIGYRTGANPAFHEAVGDAIALSVVTPGHLYKIGLLDEKVEDLDITMDDFITIHHEMGHVEYFLQYMEQPVVYREGANPGFHEAVGDVLALSVTTPKHLYEVDLLDELVDDEDITMDDFITIHHEMGHVEYYLQYEHQPVVYRRGANPGFHEAVGDVLALSVSTPQHLFDVNLLPEVVDDEEADLNFLMSMALDKIAFLPFGYLMDQWRWRVFDETTTEDKFNEEWWKLRLLYQGIIPPTNRTEEHFDPAAKYHIPADVPYIRYFISFVIQFQFHEALCNAAGHTGPLHKCDIYQSEEAGTLLSNMLKMGSSQPWPEAMEAITGVRIMDASALVNYFQPLIDYLEEKNAENGDEPGWDEMYYPDDPYTFGSGTILKPSIVALLFPLMYFFLQLF